MQARMKTRLTERNAELVLTFPITKYAEISKHIGTMFELAGMKIRKYNDKDEEIISLKEVFPDSHPGTVLYGFRLKNELTQEQLAEKLGITQTRVSELETGKRRISKAMAEKLGKFFDVRYQAFL
jgi:DNA-binding XRE family transcriptional regulator